MSIENTIAVTISLTGYPFDELGDVERERGPFALSVTLRRCALPSKALYEGPLNRAAAAAVGRALEAHLLAIAEEGEARDA